MLLHQLCFDHANYVDLLSLIYHIDVCLHLTSCLVYFVWFIWTCFMSGLNQQLQKIKHMQYSTLHSLLIFGTPYCTFMYIANCNDINLCQYIIILTNV